MGINMHTLIGAPTSLENETGSVYISSTMTI